MLLALAVFVIVGFESDPDLKAGQALMEAFEYEKASEAFDALSKRPDLSPTDRAQALVWLGLAAAELRDPARASVAFEDAVSADPLIVLPRDASPKIKALLEDARGRVRLRPKAPTPTPTELPKPAEEPVVQVPPEKPGDDAGEETAEEASLLPAAIATTATGAGVALVGGSLFAYGAALVMQADAEEFQLPASKLNEQSAAFQIGGYVAIGAGVAALAAGSVMFFTGE